MIFTTDLHQPEGPVLMPDGSFLVVEMAPDRGCVTQISSDGTAKRVVARTGWPNGLAADQNGIVWVAEALRPSLLRLTLSGKVELALDRCGDEPFLWPNDLAFGPDGALYVTDSGITADDFKVDGGIRPDCHTMPYDGRVYRIDLSTMEIARLDSGIRFANGLAFDAKGNLYVAESMTGLIYRYAWSEKGLATPRRPFGNTLDPAAPGWLKCPDGMKFGSDGNLYVANWGQGDVTVLDTDGRVLRRLRTEGGIPSNLVFGPSGQGRIYVTEIENGALEALEVGTDGLPPLG